MPKKSKLSPNPFLNAFTYDVMYKLTADQKQRLTGYDMVMLQNSTMANNFAQKADVEERARFFTKVGVPFAWVFGKLDDDKLTKLYEKFKEGKYVDMINDMLDQNLFVVTDRQVMQLLGVMATNCHSETYFLNRDYTKAGYHLRGWKKEVKREYSEEIKGSIRASKEISRLIFNTMLLRDDIPAFSGIGDCAMAVLLFIFSKESYDVKEEDIRGKFQPAFSVANVNRALRELTKASLIDATSTRGAKAKDIAFLITSLGIENVMRFQKRVFDFTYNFI